MPLLLLGFPLLARWNLLCFWFAYRAFRVAITLSGEAFGPLRMLVVMLTSSNKNKG